MSTATGDLARGLEDGWRFRCARCGNVTRFDVTATERTRRFHHFDMAGQGRVEDEDVIERSVESVACHWCDDGGDVVVEASPGG